MLRRLSSRVHQVFTGVALLYEGREAAFYEGTEVYFKKITEVLI